MAVALAGCTFTGVVAGGGVELGGCCGGGVPEGVCVKTPIAAARTIAKETTSFTIRTTT
jgi:hypothetical protein